MGREITLVKHIDAHHVVISPADGWEVTVFNVADGKFIDALVTDGEETIKITLEGPDASHGIKVKHDDATNETHVEYCDLVPELSPAPEPPRPA